MSRVNISNILSEQETFERMQMAMFILAVIIFIVLFKIPAGYGKTISKKWTRFGKVNNTLGWFLMEIPTMLFLIYYFIGDHHQNLTGAVFLLIWLTHYIQRTFIFPFLMRGKHDMAILIVVMGAIFNAANTYIQGRWIFTFSPEGMYSNDWLMSPQFAAGLAIFLFGYYTNLHSDYIIRNLRKDSSDNEYYIPRGFMFKYVSNPNYLGEMLEWLGWTVLTWSQAGLVFFIWTFANLAPRAITTHKWYLEEFGEEYKKMNRKALIPFIW